MGERNVQSPRKGVSVGIMMGSAMACLWCVLLLFLFLLMTTMMTRIERRAVLDEGVVDRGGQMRKQRPLSAKRTPSLDVLRWIGGSFKP